MDLEGDSRSGQNRDMRIEARGWRALFSTITVLNLLDANGSRSKAHLLDVKILQELAVLELVEKARFGEIVRFELAGALVGRGTDVNDGLERFVV